MRGIVKLATGVLAGLALCLPTTASAKPPDTGLSQEGDNSIIATAEKNNQKASKSPRRNNGGTATRSSKPQPTYLSKEEYAKQMAAWKAQVAAAMSHNGALATSWDQCVTTSTDYGCGQYLVGRQAIPGQPNIAIAGDPAPTAPPIPPEVIAYQAVANLKLTAPTPLIGPDPDLNKWHTAAVGYPLWLAVDGDTTPAAVSDSVYDISVSLHARLTKVVFTMGDGHHVTCSGSQVTHPWTPAVATNAKSPWCGHTYTTVPKGSATYRVTANSYWAVDWQINTTTGTLPFYQSASTDLPVSELQILVR